MSPKFLYLCALLCCLCLSRGVVVRVNRHQQVERRDVRWGYDSLLGKVRDDPTGGDVWPVAIYWVEITVGTPPRTFPVAIDTGSGDVDIPFVNCSSCIHRAPNSVYDPSLSSTSAKVPCDLKCSLFGKCVNNQCGFENTCGFMCTYTSVVPGSTLLTDATCDLKNPSAPCSIYGLLFKDEVSIGGATGSTIIQFGTITKQTSNFNQFQNIDGVMGLAGPPSENNMFQSLVAAGKIEHDLFAMCLRPGAKSNGTLTIGSVDPRLQSGPFVYVPNEGMSQGFYSVAVQSINIGAQPVEGSAMTFIIDSGTNVFLAPQSLFHNIQKSFQAPLPGLCGSSSLFDGMCFHYTPSQIAAFPNITISLAGVTLRMRPVDYLLQGEKAGDVYCLGIRNTGVGGFAILGDTTLQEYYVVFDREQHRIGWAPVNKGNCGNL